MMEVVSLLFFLHDGEALHWRERIEPSSFEQVRNRFGGGLGKIRRKKRWIGDLIYSRERGLEWMDDEI